MQKADFSAGCEEVVVVVVVAYTQIIVIWKLSHLYFFIESLGEDTRFNRDKPKKSPPSDQDTPVGSVL